MRSIPSCVPSLLLLALPLLGSPGPLAGQEAGTGLEIHALVAGLSLESSLGETGTGFGPRIDLNLSDHLAVEAEAAYFPENPQENYGYTLLLAGVKAGPRLGSFGLSATARPGLLTLGGGTFRAHNGGALTRFVLALGAAVEHHYSRRLLLRLDVGTAAVFFGDRTIRVPAVEPEVEPGTTWNRHVALALGIRL